MKVRGDFLGPPRSTDKTTLIHSDAVSIEKDKDLTPAHSLKSTGQVITQCPIL